MCSGSWHIVEAHFTTVTLRNKTLQTLSGLQQGRLLSFMLHISNGPAGIQQLCVSEVLPEVAGGWCANPTSPYFKTQADHQPLQEMLYSHGRRHISKSFFLEATSTHISIDPSKSVAKPNNGRHNKDDDVKFSLGEGMDDWK